jgi:hypothetical protein
VDRTPPAAVASAGKAASASCRDDDTSPSRPNGARRNVSPLLVECAIPIPNPAHSHPGSASAAARRRRRSAPAHGRGESGQREALEGDEGHQADRSYREPAKSWSEYFLPRESRSHASRHPTPPWAAPSRGEEACQGRGGHGRCFSGSLRSAVAPLVRSRSPVISSARVSRAVMPVRRNYGIGTHPGTSFTRSPGHEHDHSTAYRCLNGKGGRIGLAG